MNILTIQNIIILGASIWAILAGGFSTILRSAISNKFKLPFASVYVGINEHMDAFVLILIYFGLGFIAPYILAGFVLSNSESSLVGIVGTVVVSGVIIIHAMLRIASSKNEKCSVLLILVCSVFVVISIITAFFFMTNLRFNEHFLSRAYDAVFNFMDSGWVLAHFAASSIITFIFVFDKFPFLHTKTITIKQHSEGKIKIYAAVTKTNKKEWLFMPCKILKDKKRREYIQIIKGELKILELSKLEFNSDYYTKIKML